MPMTRRSPSPSAPRGCTARCCRRRQELRPGDIFTIDRQASIQFGGDRRLIFRLTSVDQKTTCHGWVWLNGYELNQRGEAVGKREIFVQLAGLRAVQPRVPNNRPSRYAQHTPDGNGGSVYRRYYGR